MLCHHCRRRRHRRRRCRRCHRGRCHHCRRRRRRLRHNERLIRLESEMDFKIKMISQLLLPFIALGQFFILM